MPQFPRKPRPFAGTSKAGGRFLSVPKGERVVLPLSMATPGEKQTIRKITGKDEVRQHLAELGFVVDSDIMVVSEAGGNLIVQVKDSRVALNRDMANRIMV